MSQATTYSVPTVGPASPTVMAQRIDDNFDAVISGHSGSARPAYAVAGMIWEDTSVAGETRLYFFDGAQDTIIAVIDTANDRVELAPQPLVDVASAATTDIGAVKSRNIRVTGTTTITSFGTIRAGTTRTVYFAAALTVTYNAASLITPAGASLAVAAGDSIDLVSLGAGNWRLLRHVKAVSTSYYESADQIITAGGLLTLAHGLGKKPFSTQLKLKCTTAERGYAIGDEIELGSGFNDANATSRGASVYTQSADAATTLYVRYGSNANTFNVLDKGTGTITNITNANWRAIVKAFA